MLQATREEETQKKQAPQQKQQPNQYPAPPVQVTTTAHTQKVEEPIHFNLAEQQKMEAVQNKEFNYPAIIEEEPQDVLERLDSYQILTELKQQHNRFLLLEDVFGKQTPVVTHIPKQGKLEKFALSEDTLFELTHVNRNTTRAT